MVENLLNQAIMLAKAGRMQDAGSILKKIVKEEPENEMAWLWLAYCVVQTDQKIFCLRKVLTINPYNSHAQQDLNSLSEIQLSNSERISEKASVPTFASTQQTPNRALPPKGKRISPLLLVAIVSIISLLCIWVVLAITGNITGNRNTSASPNEIHVPTVKPSDAPPLVVNAGNLSAHKDEIYRNRVVDVYKKNGTLERVRTDDLKELCLDWFFYRQKIQDYQADGNKDKAEEAQASMREINSWLSAYNEDDVQTMLSLIQDNGWK